MLDTAGGKDLGGNVEGDDCGGHFLEGGEEGVRRVKWGGDGNQDRGGHGPLLGRFVSGALLVNYLHVISLG